MKGPEQPKRLWILSISRVKKLIVALLFCGGCARDVVAVFPGEVLGEKGTVEVLLTNAVPNVTVAVNGKLVANGANTRRVVVNGVESGYATVAVAAGALDREFQVWVPAGGEVAVPVAAIAAPRSRTWVNTLISVAAAFLYTALF